jgi:hypothetical protein
MFTRLFIFSFPVQWWVTYNCIIPSMNVYKSKGSEKPSIHLIEHRGIVKKLHVQCSQWSVWSISMYWKCPLLNIIGFFVNSTRMTFLVRTNMCINSFRQGNLANSNTSFMIHICLENLYSQSGNWLCFNSKKTALDIHWRELQFNVNLSR